MILSIEKSEVFQNELNDWNHRLELIKNDQVKKEIGALITNLLKQVRLLDSCHSDLGVVNRISSNSIEFKKTINELRISINKKLREAELVN
jgi:hypothetical protein